MYQYQFTRECFYNNRYYYNGDIITTDAPLEYIPSSMISIPSVIEPEPSVLFRFIRSAPTPPPVEVAVPKVTIVDKVINLFKGK